VGAVRVQAPEQFYSLEMFIGLGTAGTANPVATSDWEQHARPRPRKRRARPFRLVRTNVTTNMSDPKADPPIAYSDTLGIRFVERRFL